MGVRGIFDRLDQSYLNGLVNKAKEGDSNAFAELFASVSGRQLYYLTFLFGSREKAVAALPEVFISVRRGLPTLARTDLFMPWISYISSLTYVEREGTTSSEGAEFDLSRILNLPLAESQMMLMSRQGLGDVEIGDLLNVSRRTVKRFMKSARRHLARGGAAAVRAEAAGRAGAGNTVNNGENPAAGETAVRGSANAVKAAVKNERAAARENAAAENEYKNGNSAAAPARASAAAPRTPAARRAAFNAPEDLSALETSEILDRVFSACGGESNTMPMETLSSYAVYRKERFTLQRVILAMALLVFMMLPLLFVLPGYTVSVEETGERGLPVYTVKVDSILPVGRVVASIRDHDLPVYEAGSKEFTIEPTRNGKLDISVELVNRQSVSGEYDVTAVDSEGPKLTGSKTLDDGFLINVEDAGIGVDYREIYAIDASGNVHYPVSASDESGVLFEYPDEAWDIYIPDHIGNTLHLAIKLN